jgi:prophage antirepressor-like protein
MLPIICLTRSFEGKPLPFFTRDGTLATVARHLGARLGYARDGERLVTNILDDWASEFLEGKHWVRLVGDELAAFKKAYGRPTASVGGSASSLVVLLEPGIHLVLLKTNKPAGVRLRDFLAAEVMPQLLRTGQFAPRPPDDSEGRDEPRLPDLTLVVALPPWAPTVSIAAERERRLAAQHDLRRWKLQADWLRETARTAYSFGQIDPLTRMAFEVEATEILLGRPLPGLRPIVDERWHTFEQVSEILGIGADELGVLLEHRSLLDDVCITRDAVSVGSNGTALRTCLYSDRALGRILRLLAPRSPMAGS